MHNQFRVEEDLVFSPSPIVVDRTHKAVLAFRGSREEGSLLKYALDSYGFLLQSELKDSSEQHFSFEDFAQVIGRHYDVRTPQTGEVVTALSMLHVRQMALSGSPVRSH